MKYFKNLNENGQNIRVVIFIHHPTVAKEIIPTEYSYSRDKNTIIAGIISGHIHKFIGSDNNLFSVLPPLTEYYGVTKAYTSASFIESEDVKGRLILKDDNVVSVDQ